MASDEALKAGGDTSEKADFIPVLIGADMNCYSVARALHEQYGVVSHAFGRFAAGDTKYSNIVKCSYDPDLADPAVMLETINAFAAEHADTPCLVWGCTDGYAATLMELQDRLRENCVTLYIRPELRDQLLSKASFYQMCERYGIPYPATFYADGPLPPEELTEEALGFPYPIIVKPSRSDTYWEHPFEGMKKVYTADTPADAARILDQIFGASYPDQVLLQDMVPGDDSNMRVLTAYSDRNNEVKMMCFGHVGLEEHTPTALGNPCAIITESNEPLQASIKAWLEEIGFTGFSNFDIKYDPRDGSYKVFEVNLRQGRSNYYVTGSGNNIARYVVEDRIYERDLGPCHMNQNEHFWHSVPLGVVYRYVKDDAFIARARELVRAGDESVTFRYAPDLAGNPLRWLYVKVHMHRYYKKFANSEKFR